MSLLAPFQATTSRPLPGGPAVRGTGRTPFCEPPPATTGAVPGHLPASRRCGRKGAGSAAERALPVKPRRSTPNARLSQSIRHPSGSTRPGPGPLDRPDVEEHPARTRPARPARRRGAPGPDPARSTGRPSAGRLLSVTAMSAETSRNVSAPWVTVRMLAKTAASCSARPRRPGGPRRPQAPEDFQLFRTKGGVTVRPALRGPDSGSRAAQRPPAPRRAPEPGRLPV
jgi:hypothetical protein